MVGRIRRIGHIAKAARYVVDPEKKPEVLILPYEAESMDEFLQEVDLISQHRPDIKNVGAHAFISLHPDDEISAETWKEIIGKMREELGFENAPAIAVRHHDKDHDHVHILFGSIRRDLERVPDSMEGLRFHRYLRVLERDFELTPAKAKKKGKNRDDGAPDETSGKAKERPSRDQGNEDPAHRRGSDDAKKSRGKERDEEPRAATGKSSNPAEHYREKRGDPLRERVHEAGQAKDLQTFLKRLEEHGIKVGFHIQKSGRVQGIKFFPPYRDHGVKASALGFSSLELFKRLWPEGKIPLDDYQRMARANLRAQYGRFEFVVYRGKRTAYLVTPTKIQLTKKPDKEAVIVPEPHSKMLRRELYRLNRLLKKDGLSQEERHKLKKLLPIQAQRVDGTPDGHLRAYYDARLVELPKKDQELLRPVAHHLAQRHALLPEAHAHQYLSALKHHPGAAPSSRILGRSLDRIEREHSLEGALTDYHLLKLEKPDKAVEHLRWHLNLYRRTFYARLEHVPAKDLKENLSRYEKAALDLAVAQPRNRPLKRLELRAWREQIEAGWRHDVGPYLKAYLASHEGAIHRALPYLHQGIQKLPDGQLDLAHVQALGRNSAILDYLAIHTRRRLPIARRLVPFDLLPFKKLRALVGMAKILSNLPKYIGESLRPEKLAAKAITLPIHISKALIRAAIENMALKYLSNALELPPEFRRYYRILRGRWLSEGLSTIRRGMTR